MRDNQGSGCHEINAPDHLGSSSTDRYIDPVVHALKAKLRPSIPVRPLAIPWFAYENWASGSSVSIIHPYCAMSAQMEASSVLGISTAVYFDIGRHRRCNFPSVYDSQQQGVDIATPTGGQSHHVTAIQKPQSAKRFSSIARLAVF